jgi:hypothetical protein
VEFNQLTKPLDDWGIKIWPYLEPLANVLLLVKEFVVLQLRFCCG